MARAKPLGGCCPNAPCLVCCCVGVPQVKKKMEEVEFCKNLRGVNAGQDFPRPFLSAIYHSICNCEQGRRLWKGLRSNAF